MLRPYQQDSVNQLRIALRENNSVLLQQPTGTGKTVIVSAITAGAENNNKKVWFIVPRRELITQSSTHFTKWKIPHNRISSKSNESLAYNIHIVSKNTLERRWDKIKRWPNLIINDECHLNHKFQIELLKRKPDKTKLIGLTATPERLDGLGLNQIYDTWIPGHSIPWFTERGFLSELKYFSPPVDLSGLHYKGTEADANELDEKLKKNKVYGKAIGHYKEWGTVKKRIISTPAAITETNSNYCHSRPALFFMRTVQAAYDMAERFQRAGFKFFCIEGKMKTSERKRLIQALTNGEIDGLTSCEILTYGFDCPRVEYGASLRPTQSRALYFQMVGRILRPYENKKTGYKKENALFFDHANLISEHYDRDNPGVPLFYLENIHWNFDGTVKRKRLDKPDVMRQCPYLDYMYCHRQRCEGCEHLPQGKFDFQKAQEDKIIDIKLQEKQKPKSLLERPAEEQREYIDNINQQIKLYTDAYSEGKILPGPVGELIKIAKQLNRRIMWVYYALQEKTCIPEQIQNKYHAINVPLLHEICRQMKWKAGRVYYLKKEIKSNMEKKNYKVS